MEGEVVRRRINMIASHFAPNDDVSSNPSHLLPMNCSGSLNSVVRRYDNRMYFARQASSSLGCFMRQASIEKESSTPFMPHKTCAMASEGSCYVYESPMFSRPASVESLSSVPGIQPAAAEGCYLIASEPPTFARPSRTISGREQSGRRKKLNSSQSGGHCAMKWSPTMDIAESENKYVMMVEIPGVSTNDIRVEIDDQRLSISGRRSSNYLRAAGFSNDLLSTFHKREILHGPYEVVWPLPSDVDKDHVSAEFMDGLLQITIPKL